MNEEYTLREKRSILLTELDKRGWKQLPEVWPRYEHQISHYSEPFLKWWKEQTKVLFSWMGMKDPQHKLSWRKVKSFRGAMVKAEHSKSYGNVEEFYFKNFYPNIILRHVPEECLSINIKPVMSMALYMIDQLHPDDHIKLALNQWVNGVYGAQTLGVITEEGLRIFLEKRDEICHSVFSYFAKDDLRSPQVIMLDVDTFWLKIYNKFERKEDMMHEAWMRGYESAEKIIDKISADNGILDHEIIRHRASYKSLQIMGNKKWIGETYQGDLLIKGITKAGGWYSKRGEIPTDLKNPYHIV